MLREQMNSQSSEPPEKMSDFFDERSNGYDEHMRQSVASFQAFYEAIAQPIPCTEEVLHILDVGCGTGLELGPIFLRAPNARITGIDLSKRMLEHLRNKYASRLGQITLIQGSYLEMSFGQAEYDYGVSVMTLHHLLPERKGRLYEKIRQALKEEGKYIEGDYIVSKEKHGPILAEYREKLRSVTESGDGHYHVDIPLTMEMQRELLLKAGFARVEVIWKEGEAAAYVAEA
jgi:tRNA (cmo5U34)-methyltransferase